MNDCSADATFVAPVASMEPGTVTVRVVEGAANGRLPDAGGGGGAFGGGGVFGGGGAFGATVRNRPDAPYRYDTPKRDLTLLPLIALIRYQDRADEVVPAQVTRQAPPDTVAVTVTVAPRGIVVRSLALVEGLERRFAPQAAVFVVVAPSVAPGVMTMANRISVDSRVIARTSGRAWRPGRRTAWSKARTSVGGRRGSRPGAPRTFTFGADLDRSSSPALGSGGPT